MQENILDDKLSRLYASIGVIKETDLSKVKPKISRNNNTITIKWDFMGDMNDTDISNSAYMLIHNIASLKIGLRRWFKQNSYDQNIVDISFKNSLELKIIEDLWNNDKHGYPPRNGGYSGKSPRIVNIERFLRAETKPEKDASVRVLFSLTKNAEVSGKGTCCCNNYW